MSGRASAVFFDIGDTLAEATVIGSGASAQIVLDVRLNVLSTLGELRGEGLSLGIISNTPAFATRDIMSHALDAASLLPFFEPHLLIYSSVVGLDKSSVQIFCFAADLAGHPHDRDKCVFVGETEAERRLASEASFRIAASVSDAKSVALG